jgi:hypothetical protein
MLVKEEYSGYTSFGHEVAVYFHRAGFRTATLKISDYNYDVDKILANLENIDVHGGIQSFGPCEQEGLYCFSFDSAHDEDGIDIFTLYRYQAMGIFDEDNDWDMSVLVFGTENIKTLKFMKEQLESLSSQIHFLLLQHEDS